MPVTPINGGRPPQGPPEDPAEEAPRWQAATPFPETGAPILRKTRLRKTQYQRWTQELALFIATQMSGDYVTALQRKVRSGDKDAIRLMSQIFNLIKNESGATINLQNNIGIQTITGGKRIDSIVRMLDDLDEQQRQKKIDPPTPTVDAEFEEEEEDEIGE